MYHIQGYTKKVTNVAKAMWHSRVQRFIESNIWLNELGATTNQRLSCIFASGGQKLYGNKRKEKESLLRTQLSQVLIWS